MFSKTFLAGLAMFSASALAAPATSPNPASNTMPRALGINCRGSGLCGLASLENQNSVSVMQALRDAIYSSTFPDSTVYNSGDHVICINVNEKITIDASVDSDLGESGASVSVGLSSDVNFSTGGICVFPQNLAAPLTLGSIKPLADHLLEHGCSTCGSIPVHEVDQGSNDPSSGILTFNYVASPYCVGNCISAADGGVATS